MTVLLERTEPDPQQVIADLRRERDEALARETAIAEGLGVINSSPGDLAPVFDAILEKAHRLCGATYGSLHILQGDGFRATAVRGIPREFAEIMRRPTRLGPNHPSSRLAEGEAFVQILDVAEIDDQRLREAVRLAGMHTVLAVPLRKNATMVGYIIASRQEVRPFSEKQIALLQSFAEQAVIAMENARLITETREALEQQTATAEVLQVINSSPGNLAPVFDAMLEKAMRLCDAAFGTLATFDGTTLRTAATRGVPAEYARFRMNNPPVYGPKTAPGRILAGAQLVHVHDMMDTDLYRLGDPNRRA